MNTQPLIDRKTKLLRANLDYSRNGRISTPIPKQQVRAIKDRDGVQFVFDREPIPRMIWQSIQPLLVQCSVTHQAITTDSEVLGGIPHIAGTRLSVGQVLGRLYVHGSIEKVAAYYGGLVNTIQIREAIAYAQDFIEAVCEPPESDG
jgi:uncharacterized protein (DUF433 family)